jgi:hypothetical protein
MTQLGAREPLGLGLPSVWALRLTRGPLSWDPDDRAAAVEEVLAHARLLPRRRGAAGRAGRRNRSRAGGTRASGRGGRSGVWGALGRRS